MVLNAHKADGVTFEIGDDTHRGIEFDWSEKKLQNLWWILWLI